MLAEVARGLDSHAIAEWLVVSEHTVHDHVKAVLAKTGTARGRRCSPASPGPPERRRGRDRRGHGKTGRAVAAALAGRGAEAVPLGRAEWSDLGGGDGRVRRGVRRRAQLPPGRTDVRLPRTRGLPRRPGGPGGLPLGREPVPPRDGAPPRQGRGRAPRPPLGTGLDDPPAGRLPAELRPDRAGRGPVRRAREVRLPRPGRPRPGGSEGAAGGRATPARRTSWPAGARALPSWRPRPGPPPSGSRRATPRRASGRCSTTTTSTACPPELSC